MRRPYSWLAVIVTVVLLSAAPVARASTAHGSIAVRNVAFYSGKYFRHNPCTPSGAPKRVFKNTVRRIYTYVQYSQWNGRHTDQYRWYAPNGTLYAHDRAVPYTGRGPTSDCTWLSIAGFRASQLLGRWTFRLVVDGRVARIAHFRLVKG